MSTAPPGAPSPPSAATQTLTLTLGLPIRGTRRPRPPP
ncbi:transcription factor PCL1 [Iris pallida]|uniref:Transcription factor PCL1 n=1 Tax=Iris pallida TaxID=29817 RepID=A0AAX6EB65_IRIPA|nr:transcription factor PCL1 [Iris pallida]KAJ6806951.1 transcription factor PCL1 [Iris pallida]